MRDDTGRRFGDSTVMIADEFPDLGVLSPLSLGGTVGALVIHTDNVDALWQRAVEAGAKVSLPLQERFWGDRHGEIFDPFGHRWALAQRLRDVPADELRSEVNLPDASPLLFPRVAADRPAAPRG